ncbi:MAG: hypothetical protein ACFE0R_17280 [Salinarimonas sp.]
MDPSDTDDRLERLRRGRGYTLPHHGLMARLAPDVLDLFDGLYRRINTVEPEKRHLREFLWLVILVSVRSGTASHHAVRFAQAGGTLEETALAIRIAGLPHEAGAVAFAARHWAEAIPGLSEEALRAALRPACGGARLAPGEVELACALAFGCVRGAEGFRRHLVAAFAAGLSEETVFEALCLIMLPAGLPAFVQCTWIWRDLVSEGAVPASDGLAAWAEAAQAESGAAGSAAAGATDTYGGGAAQDGRPTRG